MYLLKLNRNELKLNEKVRNSALLIGLFPSYFPFFFLLPRYVGPPGRVLLVKRDRSARSPHCLEIRGGRDRRRYTLQPSLLSFASSFRSFLLVSRAFLYRFSAFSSACLPAPRAFPFFPCTQFVPFKLERGESFTSISRPSCSCSREFCPCFFNHRQGLIK